MRNPTARARAPLRELGYTAKVVEHWHPSAKIRPDLFGVDILALKPGEPVLAVQCTSASNHSARRGKLQDNGFDRLWTQTGAQLEVWSWGKQGPRGGRKTWKVRRGRCRYVLRERLHDDHKAQASFNVDSTSSVWFRVRHQGGPRLSGS